MSNMDTYSMTTYFTIHTGNQGFTDQMMQFSPFYKLGLGLGYQYIFTPFISDRSKPLQKNNSHQADIYDFLGFNQHFAGSKLKLESKEVESIEVELSDRIIEKNNIFSYDELKNYLNNYVITNRKTGKATFVILRLERAPPLPGKGKRMFFSLINSKFPVFQDGLDLRSIYFSARKVNPIPSLFKENKYQILLHIRQGDTSFIETPWNTFIPVDRRRADFLTEQLDFDEIKSSFSNNAVDSLFQPKEYYLFLTKLLSKVEKHKFSTLCFSDGYQRAFNIINSNISRLKLSPEKKVALNEIKDQYDEKQFSIFDTLKDNKCIIGETEQSLHELINSALSADIIIVAAQQRMLPKLTANFCNGNSPIVIVLYRKNIPNYCDILKNDDERYLYTDIDNPDYNKIIIAINQLKKTTSS
jgi:hypothetical protein